MTNAEIIFNQSMKLMSEGKIRTTGKLLTMRNDDGTTEQIPEPGGSEDTKAKRLINRLVKWLKAAGLTAEQIADCIEYVTR